MSEPSGQEENINVTQDGDGLFLESTSGRICTVDDLVRACRIDLMIYNITHSDVRKWDVVLKNPETGEPTVVPAFYVSVKLMPKQIPPAQLQVGSVSFVARLVRAKKPKLASGRGLVLMDMQMGFRRTPDGSLDPFHDRRALDVALQIAQDDKFDRITQLGDLLDCQEMSDKFVKEPGFYFTTQPTIYEAHWWLQQFRKARPDAEMDVLEGNHDARLPLALMNHALAMHGLSRATDDIRAPVMSLPYLLDLPGMEIDYLDGYPNNETWHGPIRIIHGDIARSNPGGTAAALAQGAQDHTIQGHVHRIESASRTLNQRGQLKIITATSAGCLCRIDYVVPGHKRGQQWQQGLAVTEWDGEQGTVTVIPIVDGQAIYRGWKYTARERVGDLNDATSKVRRGWSY